MKHRLLGSVLVLVVGCSSDNNSNTNGETGGAAGSAGMSGAPGGGSSNAGGSGQGMGGGQGTGATSTAGKGGSTMGKGGSPGGGTGNGGASGSAGSSMGGAAAGAAGAGNGGSAGMGGSGNGGAGMDTGQSVLERNKHPSRDGYFTQPTLTLDAAAKMKKDTAFAPTFNGAMWASPLYLENGPGGKGVFFAVTTSNNVYALDETTGAVAWMKNIGSSPQSSGAGCGSIHPIGILSTPVIDATSRTIYVAGAIGTSSITRHELHALSVDDGTEKQGYPVTMTGTSGSTTFNPPPQNQRSALSLVNGIVYVAYGGHVGDCGDYHGWVFGVDTKDPTKMGGWATLGRGEGIWASGGMASDGNGVFAVTGNNTAGASDHMMADSEEVVRITGLGVLTRSNQNLYFPTSWRSMDTGDQDFGSASPVYIAVGGSHYVAAISKNGHLYLLDPANLGGMAGHVLDFTFGGSNSVHTAPGSYTTAMGTYVVLGTDNGAMCPGGGGGSKVVSIRITAGSPPKAAVAWCATNGGGVPGPIATSTDGMANAVVWYMSGSALRGVNGDTGADVYTSAGGDACSGVQQWTSPIAVKGRIVTGANGKLCSYSPQ